VHTHGVVALCSAFATQALQNDLLAADRRKQVTPSPMLGPLEMSEAADIGRARAEVVAKLVEELNVLKPQMFEDEAEYKVLQKGYPDFLTFRIAENRPDLRMKVRCIRGSVRHIRLAQELAGAHFGLSWQTIAGVWKHHKPTQYKLNPKSSTISSQP
jgi:hypothetical protein